MKHAVDILRLSRIVFSFPGLLVLTTVLATGGAFWFTWTAGFSVWDILAYSLGTGIGAFLFITFCGMAADFD